MDENIVNNQQPNNATSAENGGQGGEKMFTQEEVNRIVSERLAREREKLTQQPKEDEREVALKEREKAIAARENRILCEDYLEQIDMHKKYREAFLEALGTDDVERFKTAVDLVGGAYILKTVTTGVKTANPPFNSGAGANDRIAAAFKP